MMSDTYPQTLSTNEDWYELKSFCWPSIGKWKKIDVTKHKIVGKLRSYRQFGRCVDLMGCLIERKTEKIKSIYLSQHEDDNTLVKLFTLNEKGSWEGVAFFNDDLITLEDADGYQFSNETHKWLPMDSISLEGIPDFVKSIASTFLTFEIDDEEDVLNT